MQNKDSSTPTCVTPEAQVLTKYGAQKVSLVKSEDILSIHPDSDPSPDRNSSESIQKDIAFLEEIRETVEAMFPPSGDVVKQNHAFQLIDDWIDELKGIEF